MTRLAAAAVSPHAAAAAQQIASQGGNAVDAAIAASLVGMISEPGIVALGAGGFLTIWPPDGDPRTIDGYAVMPGKGQDRSRFGGGVFDAWMAYGGGMTTTVGPGSIAVPGAPAACQLASDLYGDLPWSRLVEPSIELARRGFPLSGAAARYLAHCHDTIFGWHDASHSALHDSTGQCLGEGDIVRIPGLAESLEEIANEGARAFYEGRLSERILADVDRGGGLLTVRDMADYEALSRDSFVLDHDRWRVATNPPPSVGGAALAAMLMSMKGLDRGWTPEAVARLVAVERTVFAYRKEHLDGSEDLAREALALLDAIEREGFESLLESPSTIHTSVVDGGGLACSATFSAGYGSGSMPPGTGIWLNNSLGELELNPGGLHSLEPGQRLLSNMAPTIARSDSGAVVAIGSPGADRITTAILQSFLNHVDLGMGLQEAVSHPRVHVELTEDAYLVACEPGMPMDAVDASTRAFEGLDMFFGGVAAAALHPDGTLETGVDPRRSGASYVTD